ncbi:MAG TPA: HisA/HisF-related TIM barrel protein [Gaiellaceae bacterium]|nr:HisA/HisF-related TIM barrel protein [Gaiellaceae bacterium]
MAQDFAIIPAVDVLEGRAVRLFQGDYDRVTTDAGDPLALIRRFAASSPPFVHVVALGAARDGGAPVALAREAVAAAAPVPVQLGGGVRSVADAEALVEAGVARVIVGTAAFSPLPLEDFVAALGDRLAVAIDVADGIVRTAGWLESTQLSTEGALDRCTVAGVSRIVCTAIDRDGTGAGPDLELLQTVRARFAGSILAAGGIRDAADVDAVRRIGIDGVIAGRAMLEGNLVQALPAVSPPSTTRPDPRTKRDSSDAR